MWARCNGHVVCVKLFARSTPDARETAPNTTPTTRRTRLRRPAKERSADRETGAGATSCLSAAQPLNLITHLVGSQHVIHSSANPAASVARTSQVEGSDSHEIVDDGQVSGIRGEKRDTVDVGRGGDRKVDGSAAWLSAAGGDSGGEATPFACHAGIDGKRVECGLDHAESLRPQRSLVRVRRNEYPKVEFGK